MKHSNEVLKAEEALSEILNGIEGARGAELLLDSIVHELDEYPTGEELSAFHFEHLRLKLGVILSSMKNNNGLLDTGHEQLQEVYGKIQEKGL